MCTIIDFKTRSRKTAAPSLGGFLSARFGEGFCVSDDDAPGATGDIVSLDSFFEAVAAYRELHGKAFR